MTHCENRSKSSPKAIFLIGWFIKLDNAHKDKELSLQNEIDFLKEEKLNLEEEIRYLKEENAKQPI